MRTTIAAFVGLAALTVFVWVSQADEKASRTKTDNGLVAVETLLPANAVMALRFDGSAAHMPAIKETASWKALEDTELTARILDVVEMLASAQSPEIGALCRRTIEHIRAQGASFAISLGLNDQLSPFGVLVLHGAADIAREIAPMVAAAMASGGQPFEMRTVDGQSIAVVSIPDAAMEIGWLTKGEHFVIVAGQNAVAQLQSIASGKSPNIASNANWTALRKSDKYTVDGFAWIDFATVHSQFAEMPLPSNEPGVAPLKVKDITSILGLDNLNSLTAQAGYRGVATWNDMRLEADGPLKGLPAILQQRTLELSELPPMPKVTTGFAAGVLDVGDVWDRTIATMRTLFRRVEPKSEKDMDEALAQMHEVLGGDPREFLLGGLGDVWCFYADSAALPIPVGFSPVMSVSVKDQATVTSGLARLAELIQRASNNAPFSIKQTAKDGRDYFSIIIPQIPIVPTILVTEKWALVSLTPASAQSFVQRENGKLPSWKPDGAVAEALKELPSSFSSITVSDPAPGYAQILGLVPMGFSIVEQQMLPTIGDGSLRLPFGIEDIPAAEMVTEPMFPNVGVGFTTATGIGSSSRQSVPSNPLGGVSAGASVPVLIALLLPAVQQAREAARRTQSKNNLKQMMLALHNYHDVFNEFPRGTIENEDLEPEERLSWMATILPYVEQAQMYNTMVQDQGWQSEANANLAQLVVPQYQNPSQSGPRENPSANDYVGISGIGPDSFLLEIDDPKSGVFNYNWACGIRNITDGTSNTIMIGDSALPGKSFMAGGSSTIRGFSQSPYLNGPDGIGSPHTGIVQFALADGSVRAISVEIDEKVLEALATKSGGEVIGDF